MISRNSNHADHDLRRQVLAQFSEVAGLPIASVTQRGRERQTAHYTLHLTGGQQIRVGTIDQLMSRSKLDQVLAVTANATTRPVEQKTWNNLIGAVISVGIDVDEAPDDTLLAQIEDWIDQYAAGAYDEHSKLDAVRAREPFVEDGYLHVSPQHLANWARREYSEKILVAHLRQVLAELGFESHRVFVHIGGRGESRQQATARYMRVRISDLTETAAK